MSDKTADQSGGTATAVEDPTAESTTVQAGGAEKLSPESAPDTDKPEDAEKISRRLQKKLDRLMEDKWRFKSRAEILERENEELRSRTEKAAASEKPKLSDFVKSGRYTNYEDAHEAYEDARDKFREKELRAQIEAERFNQGKQAVSAAFAKSEKSFQKENPAVDVKEVISTIQSQLRDNIDLQHAIVTSDDPVRLMAYLFENEEELDKLLDLPESRIDRAIGRLEAKLESRAKETKPSVLPKPPVNLTGGASPASLEKARTAAANSKDFRLYEKLDTEIKRIKMGVR